MATTDVRLSFIQIYNRSVYIDLIAFSADANGKVVNRVDITTKFSRAMGISITRNGMLNKEETKLQHRIAFRVNLAESSLGRWSILHFFRLSRMATRK